MLRLYAYARARGALSLNLLALHTRCWGKSTLNYWLAPSRSSKGAARRNLPWSVPLWAGLWIFYLFFAHPTSYLCNVLSLSPSQHPGSPSRRFSPLATTIRAFIFIALKLAPFFPRRLASMVIWIMDSHRTATALCRSRRKHIRRIISNINTRDKEERHLSGKVAMARWQVM